MENIQELIDQIFSNCRIAIDDLKSNIVDFMILEYYDSFSYLKDKTCTYKHDPIYKSQYSGNFKGGSILTGEYQVTYSTPLTSDLSLTHLLNKIKVKERSAEKVDYGHFINGRQDELRVRLSKKSIEAAIRSSSLTKVAGDVSGLGLYELLECQDALNQYPTSDNTVNNLVKVLKLKLTEAINTRVDSDTNLSEYNEKIQRKNMNKHLVIEQEHRFLEEYLKLKSKLDELIEKGRPVNGNYLDLFDMGNHQWVETPNNRYNSNYKTVNGTATQLGLELEKAYDFFLSDHDLNTFKDSCSEAITQAKPEFAKHRANIFVKALLFLIEKLQHLFSSNHEQYALNSSDKGFFSIRKPTDALAKLYLFEDELCKDGGIFKELESSLKTP